MKKNKITLTYLFIICMCFIGNAQSFKGCVFLDQNSNGIQDPNEKGIADILVTNGREVIKTNKKGNFKLPKLTLSHFVSIHLPADYKTEKFYIKTENHIGDYNFALEPKKKKTQFKFVQIADTETYKYLPWINDLKDYVQIEKPAFTMHSGDICYRKGIEFHSENLNSKTLGGRMLYSIGNHDLVDGTYGEELFEKLLGPVYYSFEEGNVLFIVTPMLHGDYKPSYTKKQLYVWLKNVLAHFPKKQAKYIFNHDLLSAKDDFVFGISETEKIDFSEYNLKAWIYGHFHNNNIHTHGNTGIKSVVTSPMSKGGIDHSPSVFRVFEVDENGDFTSDLRYSNVAENIVIVAPKENMVVQDGASLKINANIYHSSSEVVTANYHIRALHDPINWKTSLSDIVWNPMHANADWNWEGKWKIPANSIGAKFIITIKATLTNGHSIRSEEKFELTKNQHKVSLNGSWENLAYNSEHTGNSNHSVKTPLSLKWLQNTGANIFMCSPIYADGNVYIATTDEGNQKTCSIVGYNASTGEELWKFPLEHSVKNSITYSDNLVIATDTEGITYALHSDTGKLKWKKHLNIHEISPFTSGISSKKGIVYTGWGDGMKAIHAKTGDVIWTNTAWNGGEGSTPTISVGNDVLIASSHWNALFAHDMNTGKLLWKRSDEGLRFRDGSATINKDKLIIAASKSVFVLDLRTGKTIKQKITGYSHAVNTSPLVTENLIIVGTSDKGVVAFDKNTLKEVWNFKTNKALFYTAPYSENNDCTVETTPILAGETIYFGASDGYFYALNVKNGNCVWKQDFGAPIFSSVALSGNMLFVADYAGNVYGFQTLDAN